MSTAIDLFAGAGGATQGLKQAGFRVLAAVESDRDAAGTFAKNHPEVKVWAEDIRAVDPAAVRERIGTAVGELDLLTACPPCQSFSTLGRMDPTDARNDLICETERFIKEFFQRQSCRECPRRR